MSIVLITWIVFINFSFCEVDTNDWASLTRLFQQFNAKASDFVDKLDCSDKNGVVVACSGSGQRQHITLIDLSGSDRVKSKHFVNVDYEFVGIINSFEKLTSLKMDAPNVIYTPTQPIGISNNITTCSIFTRLSFVSGIAPVCCRQPIDSLCADQFRSMMETTLGERCLDCTVSCANGIQDGDETGVDCGGSVCAQCVSSCANNVRDGDEVGVDCGGSCSPSCCENGQHDVESGEEGVDCGGPCATSCASCVASELPFGVCRVQTASSCQYKCATLSTECLHEACEPLACVDRMAGWSGELCHALLPVSLCQIDSETCVMDNANDASECATLAVPSTRVLARCDIECRKPDSCGMGEKFDKFSDQCFTSGQRDCGTDYECSDQGRCVKVTPPVCSDVCAVPDELYGGCRPACHAFPCIASPSCHDIPEAPCLQIVVGVDKGQCKRALESVAACLDRTTCDAMSSSCDDDTVFLECGSVSCARAAPTLCVIGARVDSLSISDICYNDYQYACAQDKTCSEYGECIPKHTIHVKAYAFLSDGDESRLDERLRNALQQTVSASIVNFSKSGPL